MAREQPLILALKSSAACDVGLDIGEQKFTAAGVSPARRASRLLVDSGLEFLTDILYSCFVGFHTRTRLRSTPISDTRYAMPMNRQTTFEFPVDGAPFPAPAVRAVRRRRAVVSDPGGLPPFQLALEAQGDPIDVRLPVVVPVPVSARVPGNDDALAAGRLREPRSPGSKPQKVVSVHVRGRMWEVALRIVPDEYEPHALLMAFDELGECVAEERVVPDFRLTEGVARSWIEGDFE